MAKHKLDQEPEPDVFLIAISSHVNDYRLCWALNRKLCISLIRRPADIIEPGPEHPASFTAFDHAGQDFIPWYTVVSNHAAEGVLLADQRQTDFFLIVDASAPMRPNDVLQQVREIEFVLAAFPLELNALRGAHKLLQ